MAKICARCFADVAPGLSACPECGAAVNKDVDSESDQMVYAEIAKANLLRMRQSYQEAEQQCLAILRRLPNNVTAHVLLGDICVDLKDYERAREWYELSLDLRPNDTTIKSKIRDLDTRKQDAEVLQQAEKLGVPRSNKARVLYVASVLTLVAITSASAYYLGSKKTGRQTAKNVSQALGISTGQGNNSTDGPSTGDNGSVDSVVGSTADLNLMKQLSSQTVEAVHVLSFFEDPRTRNLTLIYSADEDYRGLAARLASAALATSSESLIVNVRAMKNGQLVYTADVLRSKLNETRTPSWKSLHKDQGNAWIDYVLSNEWEDAARPKAKPSEEKPQVDAPKEPVNQDPPAENSKESSKEGAKTDTTTESKASNGKDGESKDEPRGSIDPAQTEAGK